MMDKDGLLFVFPPLGISVALFFVYSRTGNPVSFGIAILSFLIALFMIFFFRDPKREIPYGHHLIVSPADGRVLKIENEVSGRKALSIFLSPLNVHINRVPVSGEVVDIRKRSGLYLAAYKPEAESKNVAIETDILTSFGMVTVRQVVGVLARRLVNRLQVGSKVISGQRFGMMRFGSRLDLLLPSSAELEITKGQNVKGGSTIIGRFKDA
ncbi:MAG: phosphatidylserine decarboxylase family protein [candidate division Zixibacteria bacterium CG_4_9_14_3_um_filter_46_8]|nr:MAG: phosphatidylserine decarboxylase family protein [candidate division Zixibacteria bacterium CG_4_9_14_3_um_filter_46_8]